MNITKQMTKLSTPYMHKLLQKGIRKVKRNRKLIPRGGYLNSLFFFYNKSGWKYQIDIIKDCRIGNKPVVSVCAFNPKISGAERADYYLEKEID